MPTAADLLLLICLCFPALQTRAATSRETGTCSVDVWRVKSRHEPVLAVGSSLVLPDHETGQLQLPRGSTLLAACTGTGNNLKLAANGGRQQHANASCSSAGELQVSGARVTAGELWCESRPLAEVKATGRRCGPANGLSVFELGFNVSGRWLPVIAVCHDKAAATTLYSHHQLLGSLLRFRRQQTQPRPTFTQGCESGELFQGVSPTQAYSPAAVQASLEAALGSRSRAEALLAKSGLSRGHLAPSADFILNTQQHASFFYVNAAPQWQIFNEGNWLSLESVLRNHAERHSLDLLVWTGTHGVLSLNDTVGKQQELFLAEGRRMAVPHFFWKLVQDPQSGEALAFVGLNDPFVTGSGAQLDLCPDVCDAAGWARRKWRRPSKGRIICCSAAELSFAVPGAPRLNATDLLPGPQGRARRSLDRE